MSLGTSLTETLNPAACSSAFALASSWFRTSGTVADSVPLDTRTSTVEPSTTVVSGFGSWLITVPTGWLENLSTRFAFSPAVVNSSTASS